MARAADKKGWPERTVSRVLFPAPVTHVRGDDHSSRTAVADGLKQPTRKSRTGRPQTLPYLALLRMGFTELPTSPPELVSSYLTVSPLPAVAEALTGGLLSVALSLGSPPVPVRNHPALRSPDFPPARYRRSEASRRSPGALRPSYFLIWLPAKPVTQASALSTNNKRLQWGQH